MESRLKLYCFKFDAEDIRQLDGLVADHKRKNADIAWGMRFNRSTVLRNLIRLAFVALLAEEEEVEASIKNAKRRGKAVLKKLAKSK